MSKKRWERPKLIVLERGKPEERVLSACKGDGGGHSPSTADGGCANFMNECEACQDSDPS
jgi:hypothetical protein